MDREKVIKALECCEDVHRAGRWASGCIACPYVETHVERCDLQLLKDAAELLKEQEAVKCPTDHDNELTRHVLFTARQHVAECLNKARVRYGGETAEYLMFTKGIRDACWAIDELINAHNEGTEQNDE